MSTWLDAVIRALDRRVIPVDVFVRDDDAGWADDSLCALLDVFAEVRWPIDLAAIPQAIHLGLARELVRRLDAGQPIGIHQHGYAHANHQPAGRPCEFGDARPAEAQRRDIEVGRTRLLGWFGPGLDPIFTPPWNRCSVVTGHALRACGIRVLSRDRTAGRLDVAGLDERPVSLDWFAKGKSGRLSRGDWGAALAAGLASAHEPFGLMLHHAAMDDGDLRDCAELLGIFARHPQVRATRIDAIGTEK